VMDDVTTEPTKDSSCSADFFPYVFEEVMELFSLHSGTYAYVRTINSMGLARPVHQNV
jgi:hypothetical protein